MNIEPRESAARLWRRFLGGKVEAFLWGGLAIGLSLFAVELAFAYGLQAFLVAIGALDPRTARLPSWLPAGSSLGLVLGFIIVIGTLRAVFNAAQIYLQGAAGEELRCRQRQLLIRWALFSESASTSEVVTLYNARTDAAGVFVGSVQSLAIQLTSAALLAVGLLVMAPAITLVAGLGFALIALALRSADRRAAAAGAGVAAESETTNTRVVLALKNLLLLQILGTQGREEEAAQKSLAAYRGHVFDWYWVTAVKYAVPQIFGVGAICAIALASTSSHGMPPGVLVSYFYILLRLLMLLSGVSQTVSTMLMTWPNARALLNWFASRPPETLAPRIPSRPSAAAASRAPIGWRLKDVRFGYPDSTKPVVEDLSVAIEPGQTALIIGPSGSGKSTLLALMLGLLKPQTGTIELRVDEGAYAPLESRREELLRGVGYVGPESFLVEGTLRDSLLYGLDAAPSQGDLADALEKAECGFVAQLPRGLDHPLTEQGQGLSAGQKQRLALARALLRRPRVLILDEATSNLDGETEARLVETLRRLKGEMTMLIVTHRPGLLCLADATLDLGSGSRALAGAAQ